MARASSMTPTLPSQSTPTHSKLDLSTVEPSIAGPGRPQDRIPLRMAKKAFEEALPSLLPPEPPPTQKLAAAEVPNEGKVGVWGESSPNDLAHVLPSATDIGKELRHGSVVIAAITSCTNTSNPSVMIAAGLLAKKAVERGLQRKPWVKTSLAPGSRVVTDYYEKAGLTPYLESLGFNLVGYGCTTCIGNSGPLLPEVSEAIHKNNLVVASVLSGNRNFEGRIHSEVRANYLMSPPLVVAFAIAGRIDIDLETEPVGYDPNSQPVFARYLPSQTRFNKRSAAPSPPRCIGRTMPASSMATSTGGLCRRQSATSMTGTLIGPTSSTRHFSDMTREAPQVPDIHGARADAARRGVTTDHISPAGSLGRPAGSTPTVAAEGLQLLRLPAGQPRGDGARHVRKRAHS